MDYLWLVGAAALAALFFFWPRQASRAAVRRVMPQEAVVAPATPAAAERPAVPEPGPQLLAFRPVRTEDLSPEQRQTIFETFESVPRPPRLLQHLLSPDFLNEASSAQLVDLITAEPLIAAKLLAAVNSPMYGLQRPASGIEQAVLYLGVNAVRAICLQYLLIESFKAEDVARARRLESTWLASALASEMTQHLAKALGFEHQGAMVSSVVLSFLGRLAIKGNAPDSVLAALPRGGFLARTSAEQAGLGLAAAEVGRLLMTQWGLPPEVISDAVAIDSVLSTPATGEDAQREARLALCYFCARVGERLANGDLADLSGLEVMDDSADDFFHLRGYLSHPRLRNLGEALKSPALFGRLRHMREALRR